MPSLGAQRDTCCPNAGAVSPPADELPAAPHPPAARVLLRATEMLCKTQRAALAIGAFGSGGSHTLAMRQAHVPAAAGFAGVWEQLFLLVSRSSGQGAYELHLVVPPACIDGYVTLRKGRFACNFCK